MLFKTTSDFIFTALASARYGLSYEGTFKFRLFFWSPLVYVAKHFCTFTIDLKTQSAVRIYKAPHFFMFLNNAVERDMEGTGRRKL